MSPINRKIIETAVDRYEHSKSSFFVKASALKPKQLVNAVKHIAKGEKEENIVAMMDITVLSSGKKGIVITEDKVYFNDCFSIAGNHIRKYSDINRLCRVEKKDDTYHYVCLYTPAPEKGQMYLDRISCSIYRDDIYNFFKTMLDLLPKEKPAEKKAKKESPARNFEDIPLWKQDQMKMAAKTETQTPAPKETEAKEKETVSVLLYGRDPKATKKIFDALKEMTAGNPVKPSDRGVEEAFEAEVTVGFKKHPCIFKYRATALGYTNPEDDLLLCVENDYEFVSGMRFGNSVIQIPGNAKSVLVCLWHDACSYPVRDVKECIDSYHRMNSQKEVGFYANIHLDENGVYEDDETVGNLEFMLTIMEDMLL